MLGRVSNLPTVWSNGLAGWVLSGQPADFAGLLILLISLSLFYTGGMYLNDAFDAEIDAQERSVRPIPMGIVSRSTIFGLGFAMLAGGVLIGFTLNFGAGLAGLALAASIVLYDWLHKKVAYGPLIMGACRFFTYVMAAYAAGGSANDAVLIGGIGLFCHTVGLTYAAKQEAYNTIGATWPLWVLAVPVVVIALHLNGAVPLVLLAIYVAWGLYALRFFFRRAPGDVPRGVVGLIAGISLFDAAIIATTGATLVAVVALLSFAATLALQKLAPGT